MKRNKIKVGMRVVVSRQNFRSLYIGRVGVITSVGIGFIPVHVTFDGENHETDFNHKELEEII